MKTLNSCMVKNYWRGFGPTRVVLLLTTIGRKSGSTIFFLSVLILFNLRSHCPVGLCQGLC